MDMAPSNDIETAVARIAEVERQIATLAAEVDRLQGIIETAGLPATIA